MDAKELLLHVWQGCISVSKQKGVQSKGVNFFSLVHEWIAALEGNMKGLWGPVVDGTLCYN